MLCNSSILWNKGIQYSNRYTTRLTKPTPGSFELRSSPLASMELIQTDIKSQMEAPRAGRFPPIPIVERSDTTLPGGSILLSLMESNNFFWVWGFLCLTSWFFLDSFGVGMGCVACVLPVREQTTWVSFSSSWFLIHRQCDFFVHRTSNCSLFIVIAVCLFIMMSWFIDYCTC